MVDFDLSFFMTWLDNNLWASILFTITIAYLITVIGELLISPIVHRAVGRLRSDTSHEDVKKRQDTLIALFHVLLRVVVWLTTIFIILKQLRIDLTTLIASAGVLGFAIGFGAQSLIKDFLSGLFIILESQYRVGDVVSLDGASGTVEQITIRSTIFRDIDGNVHFVPNGSITRVINKTLGFSKINLTIEVKSDTDIDRLANAINEVGKKMAEDEAWKDAIMQAPSFMSISNFTDSALEIKITGKTLPSRQWDVTNELRRRLLSAFKKHKIELA
jgi:moderate conductance mechanosensitive channel